MSKFLHICEVCGKKEFLTSEEAFNKGWDYPPNIGSFGAISPRTCPNCSINDTLWFELVINKTSVDDLSKNHKKTLLRIKKERQIQQYLSQKLDDIPNNLN